MAYEQYTTGSVLVTVGSTFIRGTNTKWSNGNVKEGHLFKIDEFDGRNYSIATVVSATRLQLSKKYKQQTAQGESYIITRSFSTNRSYARFYQGDTGFADIMRDKIVDPIDKDIGGIYNGTATLYGCRVVATGGGHYWDITVNATGQLCFAYNGTKKVHVATRTGTWIQV